MESHVHTISVVIPTYNRESWLRKCLKSVSVQTVEPHEVIIVNDSVLTDGTVADFERWLSSGTDLQVTSSRGIPSSSTARNTGLDTATGDIVLFLDDDVVLGDTYIEDLHAVYDSHEDPSLAGVAGYDRPPQSPSTLELLYNRLFYLGYEGWSVNRAGMHFPFGPRKPAFTEQRRADWLPGYNASFKRSVIEERAFPHWEGGRESNEDMAFCWNLSQDGYHFVVDPTLPVIHHEAEDDQNSFALGVNHGRSRIRIFRRYGNVQHTPLLLWALIGAMLRPILAPLVGEDWEKSWPVAAGMGVGIAHETWRTLTQRIRRTGYE